MKKGCSPAAGSAGDQQGWAGLTLGEQGLHTRPVLVESWETARSSRGVEEGLLRSFSAERPPQTQQYKQDEKAEKYPEGKGTG